MTDNLLDIGDKILYESCFANFDYIVLSVSESIAACNRGLLLHRIVDPDLRVRPLIPSEDPFDTYSLSKYR